jgi:enoyl-CoA hydratase/carnithine racemase
MTATEQPIVVRRDGPVGYVVLNRPEALNAITVELAAQLHAALEELGADPAIHVILVRGAGGNFCAGGDFAEVERLRAAGPSGLAPLFGNFGQACEAIATLPVPVVVAVEGVAMAGGLELLLASDVALVRDDAKLADNHTNFGLFPGGGSTQRLPAIVGRQRALGLILSGDRITGRQAADWGLVYRSFPAEEFEAGVTAFVQQLAAKSRVAAAKIKQLTEDSLALPLAEGLARERAAVIDFIAGDAGTTGVAAFTSRKA